MNKKSGSTFSRRQFARRAALLSATATLHPETILSSSQATQNSQLSTEGQLEADARYQQIVSLYGHRLDESQKANIKKMCADLQPTLEKVRNFKLENGNAPALYLKPLVERDKKPLSTTAAKKP